MMTDINRLAGSLSEIEAKLQHLTNCVNDLLIAHADEVEQFRKIENKGDNRLVDHPAHYTFSTIEVIDALEAWDLPHHLANAVKYIARAGKKDKAKTKEDLQKAVWYLNRYIDKKL